VLPLVTPTTAATNMDTIAEAMVEISDTDSANKAEGTDTGATSINEYMATILSQ